MHSQTLFTSLILALATSIHQASASPIVGGMLGGPLSITNYAACMADATRGPAPTMLLQDDSTVVINGLPASCMAEINAYNAHPNIAALNAAQGTVEVINSTAVLVSGKPTYLLEHLESVSTKEN